MSCCCFASTSKTSAYGLVDDTVALKVVIAPCWNVCTTSATVRVGAGTLNMFGKVELSSMNVCSSAFQS